MKEKRVSLPRIKLYHKTAISKLVLALKETDQLNESPETYPGQTLVSVFLCRPTFWSQYVGPGRLNEKVRLSGRHCNGAKFIAGQ